MIVLIRDTEPVWAAYGLSVKLDDGRAAGMTDDEIRQYALEKCNAGEYEIVWGPDLDGGVEMLEHELEVMEILPDPPPAPPKPVNESHLALWFTPDAIRGHFLDDRDSVAAAVRKASDEQLREIGERCMFADTLYNELHRLLVDASREVLRVER